MADDRNDRRTVCDFAAGAEPWSSIDDVVMGGVSSSRMVVEGGRAVFSGEVSLENDGGFASVRSAPREHDLSGFDGVALEVRGDGKRYALRLGTTGRFDAVSYRVVFVAPEEGWETLRFPFTAFRPVFRGRPVPGAPPLDPAEIRTFGFLISEEQEGPFRLEVREIWAVRGE